MNNFRSLSNAEEELRQVMNLFNIKNNNLLKHSYQDMIRQIRSQQVLKRFTSNKEDRRISDSYQSITRSKHQLKQATSRSHKEDKNPSYHRVITSRNKKAKNPTPTSDTSSPIEFRRSFAGSNSIFLDNHSFESPDILTQPSQKNLKKGSSPRDSRGLIRTWSGLVHSESVLKILHNDTSNDSIWLRRAPSKGVLKRKSNAVKSVVQLPPEEPRDAEHVRSEISWSDIVKHQFKEAVSNRFAKRLDDYY